MTRHPWVPTLPNGGAHPIKGSDQLAASPMSAAPSTKG